MSGSRRHETSLYVSNAQIAAIAGHLGEQRSSPHSDLPRVNLLASARTLSEGRSDVRVRRFCQLPFEPTHDARIIAGRNVESHPGRSFEMRSKNGARREHDAFALSGFHERERVRDVWQPRPNEHSVGRLRRTTYCGTRFTSGCEKTSRPIRCDARPPAVNNTIRNFPFGREARLYGSPLEGPESEAKLSFHCEREIALTAQGGGFRSAAGCSKFIIVDHCRGCPR